MNAGEGERGPVVQYVPDEICVVVEGPGRLDDPAAVYAGVAAQLNRALTARQARTKPTDALEEDLMPSGRLRAELARAPEMLRPLRRRAADQARAVAEPWVALPAEGGATLLCFYATGPDQAAAGDRELTARLDRTRELVNLLNWQLLPLPADAAGLAGGRIAAATPNWLTTATHSRDSPGTRPERIRRHTPALAPPWGLPAPGPGRFRFTFVDPAETEPASQAVQKELAGLVGAERRRAAAGAAAAPGVVVAVLDTSPRRAAVAQAAAAFPENLLLAEVAAGPGVIVEAGWGLPPEHFGFLERLFPNWQEHLPAVRAGDIEADHPDHGLFVAGIVRDIAPRAELHLIRVLGDNGLGDLRALAATLRHLPERLLGPAPPGTRLIVNLSLVAEAPALEGWLPRTAADPAALRARWGDVCATMSRLQSGLARTIDWLAGEGVLIVAAAGNAALGPASRPQPRPPAAYDSVLGVAAVTAARLPAFYSDRGDMVVFGNGVAVFGGEGIAAAPDRLAEIPPPVGERMDAVAGLFSAARLPLTPPGAGTNETGWVYWSGTSFATPVISAIAADAWLADGSLGVAALIDRVRAYATQPEAELEAASGGPFDCPAIYARQEYEQ